MSYPITQSFIPGLPKLPYRNGFGAYEGVVCHATANYNDSATGERNYEATTYNNAFVHFFVDDQNIIQVADTNYLAWGCGSIGNKRFVQIELCQTYDSEKFKNAYARYVWLIAKILKDKNLGVKDGGSLVSHAWVTKNLGGTTHQEPIDYLASYDVSWNQLVNDVTMQYNGAGFLCTIEVQCETDVRAEASHTSGYITNAHKGNIFNVIQEKNGFYQVALTDYTRGWIDKSNTMVIYS